MGPSNEKWYVIPDSRGTVAEASLAVCHRYLNNSLILDEMNIFWWIHGFKIYSERKEGACTAWEWLGLEVVSLVIKKWFRHVDRLQRISFLTNY